MSGRDIPRELVCSLCHQLCRRAVRVECCGAPGCRSCATTAVLRQRSCWSCGCLPGGHKLGLVNDEELRKEVERWGRMGDEQERSAVRSDADFARQLVDEMLQKFVEEKVLVDIADSNEGLSSIVNNHGDSSMIFEKDGGLQTLKDIVNSSGLNEKEQASYVEIKDALTTSKTDAALKRSLEDEKHENLQLKKIRSCTEKLNCGDAPPLKLESLVPPMSLSLNMKEKHEVPVLEQRLEIVAPGGRKSVLKQFDTLVSNLRMEATFDFLKPEGFQFKLGSIEIPGNYEVKLNVRGHMVDKIFVGKANYAFLSKRKATVKGLKFLTTTFLDIVEVRIAEVEKERKALTDRVEDLEERKVVVQEEQDCTVH